MSQQEEGTQGQAGQTSPADRVGHGSRHLFVELADALREKIYSREWLRGEKIPSEHELMERFGVSRGTVRRAIGVLVDEGWLVQRHGSGTYVSRSGLSHEAGVRPLSFAESLRMQGKKFKTDVLSKMVVPANQDVADNLHIEEGEPAMFMRRVRSVDGTPVLCQESWTNLRECPGIEKLDFTKESLFDAVQECSNKKISYSVMSYQALVAGREHAEYLQCEESSALLRLEQIVHFEDNDICEWSFTWLPPGQSIVGKAFQPR
ncbi:MAG: GntR family transcriptional regulator [Tractidigestivibacter sp.]|jgi:DNA-binding GntR family transcriptional regulator|uniref:GntR family transcriptional regulator n=1 Tax=Tractidigestivibacter sp. TaxID=2847320 RepID=UPI003D8D40B1